MKMFRFEQSACLWNWKLTIRRVELCVNTMIAIIDKIESLIAQGENSAVEFKAAGVHADSIAREMVAFANSQGGVILLGVADNGDIEGLDDSRPWEEWIANIARHNIVPPLVPQYGEVVIAGKRVGFVEVDKGTS